MSFGDLFLHFRSVHRLIADRIFRRRVGARQQHQRCKGRKDPQHMVWSSDRELNAIRPEQLGNDQPIAFSNCFPIRSTMPTTSEFPLKNARQPSLTPTVCPSGNMFSLSNSIGVSLRKRFPSTLTTCLKREGELPPSPVMIVREGRSSGSGNTIAPSEYAYSWPL